MRQPNTNETEEKIKQIAVSSAKGAAIGIANIIPGVSGGTIALLLGIYTQLTEAIGNFFIASWKQKRRYIAFLLPLAVGAGVAILVFARVMEWLYESYPQHVGFFFLGLIAVSLPTLLKDMKEKPDRISWLLCVGGFAVTLGLGIMDTLSEEGETAAAVLPTLDVLYGLKLFLSGALASASMVVPGISGSFIMLLLGEYHNILAFINAINVPVLAIFAAGAGIGVVLVAKLINLLLGKFYTRTMMFIVGLVVASLYVVWPGITFETIPLIINIATFLVGGFIVFRFGHIE
jgi:putative membrane protein